MSKRAVVRVEGMEELNLALGELSKAAAKGVMRRTLVKAAKPMVDAAQGNAPVLSGELKQSIVATAKVKNIGDPGDAAYSETMRAGGSRDEALTAMRDARRAGGSGSMGVEAYVGPVVGSKRAGIKAMVQEYGSVHQAPQPYMRPAYETAKQAVLDLIKDIMTAEIAKAVERARKRALKKAGKG